MDVDKYLGQLLADRHEAFGKALHYLNVSMIDSYNEASRMIDRIDAVIYAVYGSAVEHIDVPESYPVIIPKGHEVISSNEKYTLTAKKGTAKKK